MIRRILVSLVLLVCTAGLVVTQARSTSRTDAGNRDAAALRGELSRSALRGPDTLIVTTGGSDAEMRETMRFAYAEMFAELSGREDLDIRSADEVTPHDLRNHPLILIGSPETNRWVADAIERFPIYMGEYTQRILDDDARLGVAFTQYYDAAPFMTLALRGVNPYNPSHGMIVFTAARDRALVDHRFSLDFDGDYLLRIRDIKIRWGSFSAEPGRSMTPQESSETNLVPKGSISDYEKSRVLAKINRRSLSGSREQDDKLYEISVPRQLDVDQVSRSMERRAELLRTAASRISVSKKEPRLRMYFYADRQTKAELTGNFATAHGSSIGEQVHAVFDAGFRSADIAPEMEIAREDLYPQITVESVRRGFPIAASDYWHGRKLGYWAARLLAAGVLPTVETLLDNKSFENLGPWIAMPAAGSLCQFIWNENYDAEERLKGLGTLMKLGHFPNQPAADAVPILFEVPSAELDQRWRAWIQAQRSDRRDPTEEPAWESKNGRPSGRQKGIRFQHSYRIETGLGSRGVTASLEEMRGATDAEWISLRPSASLAAADGHEWTGFPERTGVFANGTPDGAIEECLDRAERSGIHVLLAPRLRVPGGEGVRMPTEEDWRLFFEKYRSFILHHALVAEYHHADMLAIGTGLGVAAMSADHLQEWRELIRDVRNVYRGPLVYAARDFEEAAAVGFWSFLDAIGVDVEISAVSDVANVDGALTRQASDLARRAQRLARRHRKPVLLTEVRVSPDALSSPAAAVAVQALLSELSRHDWFAGVYWSRWFSDPAMNGRPTLGVAAPNARTWAALSDWYRRLE